MSSLFTFVSSVGGCGGFFFSCRFCGTAGYGSGGIPSLDATCAGGGFGRLNGGGSGGGGPANVWATMPHTANAVRRSGSVVFMERMVMSRCDEAMTASDYRW